MAISISEITGIDVRNGRFELRVYAEFHWCDPRQAFDSAESGTQSKVYVGSEALRHQEATWSPDLAMMNEVAALEIRKREVTVHEDGRIRLRGFFSAQLAAYFDLRRFPFDSQTLPIQVGSLTWNDETVKLKVVPDGVGLDQDFELAEWRVGKVTSAVRSEKRGASDVRFDLLEINTTIHRRVGYYLWRAALPLFLIVALGWTVFWMPDGLGTRIRLSATVMLTIVAYQFALAADLPKIAYVSLFSAFMTLSFLIVALCVAVNILVFYRQSLGDELVVERSDRLCRWLIPAIYFLMVTIVVLAYLL